MQPDRRALARARRIERRAAGVARRRHAQARWAVMSRVMEIGAAGAVLVPTQAVVQRFAPRARPRVPRLFLKLACSSLGLQVRLQGAPLVRQGGVLFVSNHLGWADIPALGSKLLASFVAKAEIDEWGLFGVLTRLQGAIYVKREDRMNVGDQTAEIAARLARGGRVIMFPEGTNSDGTRVLPFKSSLFAVAKGPAAPDFVIQPITLAYTRVNGMPVTRRMLPSLAWVGDTELKPHIAEFMRLGKIRADVLVHPPVYPADFADRKALARHCQRVVAAGYISLMHGADTVTGAG
jgi:1-acyl-sn-glycerol-3-phosphate acyltransferase